MKKLHFKLFKRLSCIVVFTTLFFSHVQAKGINDAIQLPDFKSGKTIWVIRAGVGFNGFTGSSIETTKLQWENNDWNAFKYYYIQKGELFPLIFHYFFTIFHFYFSSTT